MDAKPLLTPNEAANLLALSSHQVLKLARSGELPAVHLPGAEIRFDGADLGRFIESRKTPEGKR